MLQFTYFESDIFVSIMGLGLDLKKGSGPRPIVNILQFNFLEGAILAIMDQGPDLKHGSGSSGPIESVYNKGVGPSTTSAWPG
jgi:hypothetical protein